MDTYVKNMHFSLMHAEETWTGLILNGAPRFYNCPPEWSWSPPPLRDHDLWCVFRGRGELRLGSENFALQPGVSFLLQPGDQPRASHQPRQPLLVFAMHFTPIGFSTSAPRPRWATASHLLWFRQLAEQCTAAWTTQSRALCTAAAFHLLQQMLQDHRSPMVPATHQRLQQLIREIRHHPGRDWAVPRMAEHCGLSRAHFTRLFEQQTGLAPNGYVIAQRLESARYFLRETTLTVGQIADLLGYRDAFFFCAPIQATHQVYTADLAVKAADPTALKALIP
jgi:AraC-like DNA-binding protein